MKKFLHAYRTVINIALCIILFVYIFNYFDSYGNRNHLPYSIFPDSAGYITHPGIMSDPWRSSRTPLYPFICGFFFSDKEKKLLRECYRDHTFNEMFDPHSGIIELLISDKGLGKNLERIVFLQRIVQSVSIVILFYALSLLFPNFVAFIVVLIGTMLLPLANVYHILTEPIFQSLILMTLSFIILFKKYQKYSFLYFACLLAVLTYMCRPAGIFIVILCIGYIIYFVFREKFKNLKKFLYAGAILSLSFLYILYISYPIGSIVFGTMTERSKNGFSLFFLEKEDINNMPTSRSKIFAKTYLENMDNFRDEYKNTYGRSLPLRTDKKFKPKLYLELLNPSINLGVSSTLKVLSGEKSFQHISFKERTKLAIELANGIKKRHFMDILKLRAQMLFSGLGFYKNLNLSYLSSHYGILYEVGVLCIFVALIIAPPCRFCIILLCITHILHIAACAYGHCVIGRFTQVTEFLPLIAMLLSLWVILDSCILLLKNRRLVKTV